VKGIVLAGGLGTRLQPMTKVVNKHLLDVFDEPMIQFPIRSLAQTGLREIVLVTGNEIDQFQSLLGSGSKLGVDLVYERQEGEGGIADALAKAERHLEDGEAMGVILGDNIFQENLTAYVDEYRVQGRGGKVLLKEVSLEDARRFGVATVEEGRCVHIEEKPADPQSSLVVTGFYMYDDRVFDVIRGLTPSDRGELEITDVNNAYVEWRQMTFNLLRGWWTDAGTPPSKLKASILVALEKGVTFHA
jgi:glucose-1-phosphate thymidylyltransferase